MDKNRFKDCLKFCRFSSIERNSFNFKAIMKFSKNNERISLVKGFVDRCHARLWSVYTLHTHYLIQLSPSHIKRFDGNQLINSLIITIVDKWAEWKAAVDKFMQTTTFYRFHPIPPPSFQFSSSRLPNLKNFRLELIVLMVLTNFHNPNFSDINFPTGCV